MSPFFSLVITLQQSTSRAANQYGTSVFCTDFTCKIREYEFGLQNTDSELCQFCHLKYCCQNKAYLFWVAIQSRFMAFYALRGGTPPWGVIFHENVNFLFVAKKCKVTHTFHKTHKQYVIAAIETHILVNYLNKSLRWSMFFCQKLRWWAAFNSIFWKIHSHYRNTIYTKIYRPCLVEQNDIKLNIVA